MPIQIRILPKILHILENQKLCLTYFHNSASLHNFTFIVIVKGVITFNILDSVSIFLEKVQSNFTFGLSGKMMTIRPDPQHWKKKLLSLEKLLFVNNLRSLRRVTKGTIVTRAVSVNDVDPDPPGSAWIRFHLAVLDPDPGAWKLTKIFK
jgi:hypothetical protein